MINAPASAVVPYASPKMTNPAIVRPRPGLAFEAGAGVAGGVSAGSTAGWARGAGAGASTGVDHEGWGAGVDHEGWGAGVGEGGVATGAGGLVAGAGGLVAGAGGLVAGAGGLGGGGGAGGGRPRSVLGHGVGCRRVRRSQGQQRTQWNREMKDTGSAHGRRTLQTLCHLVSTNLTGLLPLERWARRRHALRLATTTASGLS